MDGGDEGDLPSAPDMTQRSGSPERRRSPAGGCRAARPDCGSGPGFQPPGTSRLWDEALLEVGWRWGRVDTGWVQDNFKNAAPSSDSVQW